jgi:hypothetical protein
MLPQLSDKDEHYTFYALLQLISNKVSATSCEIRWKIANFQKKFKTLERSWLLSGCLKMGIGNRSTA